MPGNKSLLGRFLRARAWPWLLIGLAGLMLCPPLPVEGRPGFSAASELRLHRTQRPFQIPQRPSRFRRPASPAPLPSRQRREDDCDTFGISWGPGIGAPPGEGISWGPNIGPPPRCGGHGGGNSDGGNPDGGAPTPAGVRADDTDRDESGEGSGESQDWMADPEAVMPPHVAMSMMLIVAISAAASVVALVVALLAYRIVRRQQRPHTTHLTLAGQQGAGFTLPDVEDGSAFAEKIFRRRSSKVGSMSDKHNNNSNNSNNSNSNNGGGGGGFPSHDYFISHEYTAQPADAVYGPGDYLPLQGAAGVLILSEADMQPADLRSASSTTDNHERAGCADPESPPGSRRLSRDNTRGALPRPISRISRATLNAELTPAPPCELPGLIAAATACSPQPRALGPEGAGDMQHRLTLRRPSVATQNVRVAADRWGRRSDPGNSQHNCNTEVGESESSAALCSLGSTIRRASYAGYAQAMDRRRSSVTSAASEGNPGIPEQRRTLRRSDGCIAAAAVVAVASGGRKRSSRLVNAAVTNAVIHEEGGESCFGESSAEEGMAPS